MSAHEDFTRTEPVRGSSDRSFGLIVGGVLAAIGLMPLVKGQAVRWPAAGVGAILVLLALISPTLLHRPNLLWMRLGLLLNRFMSPIVIGAMFYLGFTPMGILLRLLGKDPLRLRLDRDAASYWIERAPPGPAPDSMARQF
jgi:hypothetical protein